MVDNSVVGGQTIAAGTGGIDGSDAVIAGGAGGVPDQQQRRDQDPLLHAELRRLQPRRVATRRPRRTSTAAPTTARPSPPRSGAAGAMDAKNIVEGAVVYDGDLGGVGILASVVGLYGELKNDAEDGVRRRQVVGRPGRCQRSTCSASSSPAASAPTMSATTQRNFFTAGIGAALGPVNTSITYGQIFDANSDFEEATGHRRLGLQSGVLGRYRAGAGPGAGGRRGQVRQRRHAATPAPATRAGRRSAGSPSRSEPRLLQCGTGGGVPPPLSFDCRMPGGGGQSVCCRMHLVFAQCVDAIYGVMTVAYALMPIASGSARRPCGVLLALTRCWRAVDVAALELVPGGYGAGPAADLGVAPATNSDRSLVRRGCRPVRPGHGLHAPRRHWLLVRVGQGRRAWLGAALRSERERQPAARAAAEQGFGASRDTLRARSIRLGRA